MSFSLTTLGLLCLISQAAAAATKSDIVEFTNGDRITCEIKHLERGRLTVKTDGIGTVSIEWDDIARVTSRAAYDIEQSSGRRIFGTLGGGTARTIEVVAGAATESVPMDSIVSITPLGGTFWRRLDGAIDGGFSFTQANVQTEWDAHANISYRSRQWYNVLDFDSALTTREDADRQTRNSLSLQTQRFLRPRWSVVGFGQFQQNEELSLNLRAVLGGGVERVLARSNRMDASVLAGLAYTRESYAGAGDNQAAEAVAGFNLGWFTFDGRSTSFDFSAFSFTALNHDARQRFELNSKFKSDIVGDLYWSINAFESFSSNPPAGHKRNDLGVSATVGWSF